MRLCKLFIFAVSLCISISSFASVSTLVADTKSGLILASKNATLQQYPASLTKVMTLYMTFSAIDKGILKMDDKLPVSLKAARQPRSKLYVKAGQTISVKDAIMALIIISANDVAVVLAESLAPNETEFAKMMTKTARELGLKNTTFKNASGLHNKGQVTTAQDMAILTMAMIHHFPHYYKLFSEKTFEYNGKTYRSHNHVQKKYEGAEGLKTGYISAVGYNIISTAKRNDSRLVSVVIGQDTVALRDRQAMRLLDKGFSNIEKHKAKSSNKNILNKTAILKQPNMLDQLQVMADRLDNVIKSPNPINRSKLLALNPFSIKTAQANELEYVAKAEEVDIPQLNNSTVEEGSNIAAEEKAEAEAEAETETQKEEIDAKIEEDEDDNSDEVKVIFEDPVQKPQKKEIVKEKQESPKKETNKQPIIKKEVKKEAPLPKEQTPTIKEEIVEQGIVPAYVEPQPIVETKTTETKAQEITKPEPKKQTLKSLTPKQKTAPKKAKVSSWGIQVGAFTSVEKATAQAQKAINVLKTKNKEIKTEPKGAYHRARVFGFNSKKSAQNACKKLKSKKIDCMIVK